MRIFVTITEKFRAMQQRSTNKTNFYELVLEAVSDGNLNDEEITTIGSKYQEFGLTKEDIKELGTKAYEKAAMAIMADNIISDDEAEQLRRIQKLLMIPDTEINEVKVSISRIQIINQIQNGVLPNIQPTGLILQKGEIAHLEELGNLLEEKVIKRGYVGGSQGLSFRIAKGITYRVGASKGQLVSETAMVPASTGRLVITDRRVVFSGDRKSFNIKLDSILNIEMYTDGLNITDSRGTPRVIQLTNILNTDIVGSVLTKSINNI
jgi:hypothetical protein